MEEKENQVIEKKEWFRKSIDNVDIVFKKTWQGAAIGSVLAALFVGTIIGIYAKTGFGQWIDIGIPVLLVIILFFLIYFLLGLLRKLLITLPKIFLLAIGSVIIIFINLPLTRISFFFFGIGVLFCAVIGFFFLNGIRKLSSWIVLAVVLIINGYIGFVIQNPGNNPNELNVKHFFETKESTVVSELKKDPVYQAKFLYYGSGNDKRRPEYRDSVKLTTQSVDVTPFFDESSGVFNTIREWYWDFNAHNYPLNARVWYPDGQGPFPLIIMVHGNHKMEEYSESGYDYIGKYLAERGYIFVSIDENFLNGSFYHDYQQTENFTRGYLILKHLQYWRKWNEESGNILYKKADMDNIAIIGHSRGGQAAAIAAMLNKMDCYHLDANKKFDFNFNIKSIVQIAPNDPYTPTNGNPLYLKNINYLALQGAYDADVFSFLGSRQYNRISFTDDYYFKSLIYIYHANHGQFNTVWGRNDYQPPVSWFINTTPIMKASDQQKIAEIYIYSFLEATLKGHKQYLPLFKDYRNGAELLPADVYITQFEDSRFQLIHDYEMNLNPAKMNPVTGTISGEGLKTWSQNGLTLRDGTRQLNEVVYLGWDRSDTAYKKIIPRYSFHFQDTNSVIKNIRVNDALVFNLCNNRNSLSDTVDISIELVTSDSVKVAFPLSQLSGIIPPLRVDIVKLGMLYSKNERESAEKVLKTVIINFEDIIKLDHNFNPMHLTGISFVFDRTAIGEIILDRIGILKN